MTSHITRYLATSVNSQLPNHFTYLSTIYTAVVVVVAVGGNIG